MTKKDVLEWAIDEACNQLFANSANYMMTKPKAGCERIHAECEERIVILEEMIRAEQ